MGEKWTLTPQIPGNIERQHGVTWLASMLLPLKRDDCCIRHVWVGCGGFGYWVSGYGKGTLGLSGRIRLPLRLHTRCPRGTDSLQDASAEAGLSSDP